MKIPLHVFFFLIILNICTFGQGSNGLPQERLTPKAHTTNWTVKPFDQQIFIENKGQLNNAVKGNDEILFSAKLGQVNAYFTKHSIIYRYDESPKRDRNRSEEHTS